MTKHCAINKNLTGRMTKGSSAKAKDDPTQTTRARQLPLAQRNSKNTSPARVILHKAHTTKTQALRTRKPSFPAAPKQPQKTLQKRGPTYLKKKNYTADEGAVASPAAPPPPPAGSFPAIFPSSPATARVPRAAPWFFPTLFGDAPLPFPPCFLAEPPAPPPPLPLPRPLPPLPVFLGVAEGSDAGEAAALSTLV